MGERDDLQLQALEAALARLAEALDHIKTDLVRDASIKRFEFTFEMAWNAIVRVAHLHGIEVKTPRSALRKAMQIGWIDDSPVWLDMIDDRNRTVHAYNETIAESIYERLPEYHAALTRLLERLKQVASE